MKSGWTTLTPKSVTERNTSIRTIHVMTAFENYAEWDYDDQDAKIQMQNELKHVNLTTDLHDPTETWGPNEYDVREFVEESHFFVDDGTLGTSELDVQLLGQVTDGKSDVEGEGVYEVEAGRPSDDDDGDDDDNESDNDDRDTSKPAAAGVGSGKAPASAGASGHAKPPGTRTTVTDNRHSTTFSSSAQASHITACWGGSTQLSPPRTH